MSRLNFKCRTMLCLVASVVLQSCAPLENLAGSDAPPFLHDGFPVGTPSTAGMDPKPLAALSAAIARGDFPKTNAVLIVRGGKLVYEAYFGSGGRDVLNDTRSAMKSVTSLAVGVAIHDGAIPSVKSKALSYFDDLRPLANDTPAKEAITVEDLLTMSSALDCNDDDDNSPGNEDKMHPQPNWSRWAVDLPEMAGYHRDENGLGPWRYCSTGAFLLGQVMQRAAHTPVDKYIEHKILTPLGITKWEWPYSPSGETMTGGGLRLRARDAAKIAWMLVDDGRWRGTQIVPTAWIDASLSVHRKAYADANYGYLFWQHFYNTGCGRIGAWHMAGNGGNSILAIKELDTAIVIARSNYNTHGMHQQTTDMLEKYLLPSLPCTRPTSATGP